MASKLEAYFVHHVHGWMLRASPAHWRYQLLASPHTGSLAKWRERFPGGGSSPLPGKDPRQAKFSSWSDRWDYSRDDRWEHSRVWPLTPLYREENLSRQTLKICRERECFWRDPVYTKLGTVSVGPCKGCPFPVDTVAGNGLAMPLGMAISTTCIVLYCVEFLALLFPTRGLVATMGHNEAPCLSDERTVSQSLSHSCPDHTKLSVQSQP